MNTACGPLIEVTAPPISVTKNFVHHQSTTSLVDNEVRKLLIQNLNHLLTEVRSNVIIKMSKEEAGKYLQNSAPILSEIPKIEKGLYTLDEKANELIPFVKVLWLNLKGMIEDIHLIAEREDIDENSDEYKEFLHELVNKETSHKKTFGKKPLMDLFD